MPRLDLGGLFFNADDTSQAGIVVYLPVALRTAPLLWLRIIWGRQDELAPPKIIGDAVTEVVIASMDELTDTVVVEDTVENIVSITDIVNEWEHVYYDIDISSYCDADTSHLYIMFNRKGDDVLDTLDTELCLVNARTLLTQEEEVD